MNGDFTIAAEYAKKAIDNASGFAQAYNTLGYCRQMLGHLNDAALYYKKAIQLDPGYVEAYNHLGVLLSDQGNHIEAVEFFKKAIQLDPGYAELYNNMAIARKALLSFDDAIENYRKAVAADPTFAEAFANLANTLRDKGLAAEAIENYNKALALKPDYADAYWNRSLALLLNGNLAEGFSQYHWRRDPSLEITTYPHKYDKPRWDGSDLNGKTILIHFEQGYGDNIQFIRYLPKVKALGATVLFEARKPTLALIKDMPCIDKLIEARADRPVEENFDYFCALMDLPAIMGTTLETIPADIPYIFADQNKAGQWKTKINSPDFKVGIVWAGRTSPGDNIYRACHLNNFAELSKIKGVKVYGLQKDDAANQVLQLEDGVNIENLGEQFADFSDTAAAIENLDLVISVDTAVLHLAGAMGKPAWGLLPLAPDWRWLLDRDDSPWYPTIKLFRQKKHADWKEVFTRIADELRSLL